MFVHDWKIIQCFWIIKKHFKIKQLAIISALIPFCLLIRSIHCKIDGYQLDNRNLDTCRGKRECRFFENEIHIECFYWNALQRINEFIFSTNNEIIRIQNNANYCMNGMQHANIVCYRKTFEFVLTTMRLQMIAFSIIVSDCAKALLRVFLYLDRVVVVFVFVVCIVVVVKLKPTVIIVILIRQHAEFILRRKKMVKNAREARFVNAWNAIIMIIESKSIFYQYFIEHNKCSICVASKAL